MKAIISRSSKGRYKLHLSIISKIIGNYMMNVNPVSKVIIPPSRKGAKEHIEWNSFYSEEIDHQDVKHLKIKKGECIEVDLKFEKPIKINYEINTVNINATDNPLSITRYKDSKTLIFGVESKPWKQLSKLRHENEDIKQKCLENIFNKYESNNPYDYR